MPMAHGYADGIDEEGVEPHNDIIPPLLHNHTMKLPISKSPY